MKRAAGKAPRKRVARPKKLDAATRGKAIRTWERLKEAYPEAECALRHENAYQLLVATILSAQCTDARVNLVTPELFRAYPKPIDLADAPIERIEELIHSTGFFRNNAKNLKGMAQRLVSAHGGEVPRTMDGLLALPGVARKTANVVLGTAFDTAEGVVVDTHVDRLSHRLGWTNGKNPAQIERDLMTLFPRDQWIELAHTLIQHGRRICLARKPRCPECPVKALCPSSLA